MSTGTVPQRGRHNSNSRHRDLVHRWNTNPNYISDISDNHHGSCINRHHGWIYLSHPCFHGDKPCGRNNCRNNMRMVIWIKPSF
jgi:hypothetical protein